MTNTPMADTQASSPADPTGSGGIAPEQQNATASRPEKSDGNAPRQPRKPPAPQPEVPGPANRLFQALSVAGLPVLLALTALLTTAELLHVRTLWFSDEVRHADVYMRLLGGDWLTLSLNGLPYPDKPPLYFWFLRALDALPGVDAPMLFFLGTALSAMLFVGSTWLLARATGHDRRVAFAAGLLTTGCLFFAGLAHYPRMDLAFAAIITLSLLCLYRGWIKASAPLWLTFGFVLAGVAALIKGPLGLAFPLLSSLLFLLWRGTPGRLNGRDGMVGFALMLLMLLGWVGALLLDGQADYLREIFGPQIAGRMFQAWHHAAPWWYYLAALPLLCLPWTFLLLFINWWAALKGLPAAWKLRRENGGRGWLWIVFLSGTALISAVSSKIAIYLMPLMPALTVLAAHALLNLTPRRSRWFFATVALFCAVLGLAMALAHASPWLLPLLPETWTAAIPPVAHAWLDNTAGLALMGAVFLVLAALLLLFTRRAMPGGALLVTSLGMMAAMQPYALVVAPSLDTMLSPRAQAEVMADHVRQGYTAAAYRVYPGVYSYYLNDALTVPGQPRPVATVREVEDAAGLNALLAEAPRLVIAMSEKHWNRWEDKPADMHVIYRQWMVDQPYVVAVLDRPDNAPAHDAADPTLPSSDPFPQADPGSVQPERESPDQPAPAQNMPGAMPEGNPGQSQPDAMPLPPASAPGHAPAQSPDADTTEQARPQPVPLPQAEPMPTPDAGAAPAIEDNTTGDAMEATTTEATPNARSHPEQAPADAPPTVPPTEAPSLRMPGGTAVIL